MWRMNKFFSSQNSYFLPTVWWPTTIWKGSLLHRMRSWILKLFYLHFPFYTHKRDVQGSANTNWIMVINKPILWHQCFLEKHCSISICIKSLANVFLGGGEKICMYYILKTSAMYWSKYSHLSNKRGGWNKHRGGAKVTKSINMKAGINVKGGIVLKKLLHNCNKWGVEGGKNLRNQ